MELILASGSPRRRELLERMGIGPFLIHAPDVEEGMDPALKPHELVEGLSLQKARAAAEQLHGDCLILAADTVVTLDGAVLGKPADEGDAFRMLSALSGRTHAVYTGLTLLGGGRCVTAHEVTQVTFRTLTEAEIRAYIATGEPMDKAGAYGIQGMGAVLIPRIDGDYCNVMGLPLARLHDMLGGFGISVLRGGRGDGV